MGAMGLIITPVLVRHLLGLLGYSLGLWLALTGLIDALNGHIGSLNPPLAAQLPHPFPPTHPRICAIHDIQQL